MSYNYNPIGGSQLPMMPVPVLGGMTNGTNFISPSLATTLQQITGATGPAGMLATIAGINDNPLEFNHSHKKIQLAGAGPMDLESVAEAMDAHGRRSTSSSRIKGDGDRGHSADRRVDDASNSSIDSSDKSNNVASMVAGNAVGAFGVAAAGHNQSEIMFNGMMGMPQSLMMMPGMMNMMDPTTMMGIQQFPMMGQLNAMQPAPPLPSQQQQQQHQQQQSSHAQHSPPTELGNVPSVLLPTKEVITCKSCTLFPPNPSAPLPTTRERPPGCRTVFVGGLPENVTEDIIREIFERCGEITTLRLSKKHFCHIRFVFEPSVDSAIYLSGYRIRLGTSTEATNCGRLHVDYAQARDDQYEWECKQRQLQREQRHRERVERDRLRPLSPPPIVHFTDHEAATVSEKLKQDDNFTKAVQVLITWLERGDCNKKNSNTFYSMIQSTNSHVRRLQTEKSTYEEELQKAREHYRKQMYSMSVQFTQIEKVFGAASHKKVWDHFTKAQRKNIDMWKKQSMEIRTIQLDDFEDDDEMDMSDDDRDMPRPNKRIKLDNETLQIENESLRTELAAYRSDADMVKSMLELDTDVKEKQMKVLQETIRNLQTQLLDNKSKEKEQLTRVVELEAKLKQANVKELLLKTKIVEACKQQSVVAAVAAAAVVPAAKPPEDDDVIVAPKSGLADGPTTIDVASQPPVAAVVKAERIDVDVARIIGLVATFLVVHPFGASLDYVFSYVQRSAPQLRPKELEEILSRYGSTFNEEVSGVGANIERKWKFCGFDTVSMSDQ